MSREHNYNYKAMKFKKKKIQLLDTYNY
jgi:hypothetical protein